MPQQKNKPRAKRLGYRAPLLGFLDDERLFEAARWIELERTKLRHEFAKRAGSSARVFCDCPALVLLERSEIDELEELVAHNLASITKYRTLKDCVEDVSPKGLAEGTSDGTQTE